MQNLYHKVFVRIFCSLVMLGGMANAQIIIIEDIETNEPIEMATISSSTPNLFVVTNGKGEADISEFRGLEKIEIRSMGFNTVVLSYEDLKEKYFEIKLKPSSFSLSDVVVSATKWRQDNDEVPGKITSISMTEVALQNPQTAADLLGSSGEVFIQKSQQGGGSPMIRGFSTNRLLYVVDGVRMNTAIFRSGNIQNVISLDAFATEQTEVLFGPGSVIYGSDAIGGVMNFTTLSPHFASSEKTYIKGSALTRFSSANKEFTGHFDVHVGWRKFAMLTSVSYSDFDDLKMGADGPDEYLRPFYVQRQDSNDVIIENDDPLVQNPTGYSQMNLMQKFAYKVTKSVELSYAFHYSETSSYGRYDRHIRYDNDLPRSAVWDYGPQKWMMNHFKLSSKKANVLFDEMQLNLAHQYFNESRVDRDFKDPIENSRDEQVNAYSFNLDFAKRFYGKHEVYYGLEFVNNAVQSEGSALNIENSQVLAAPSRYPNAAWATSGIYANYHFQVSEQWNLQAGLRYAHFFIDADFSKNQVFYPLPESQTQLQKGATTGSLGAIYTPGEKTTIRANFSTGFRAPNIDDIGKIFDSEPGSVVLPNTDLRPEYVYNGELSFAQIFGNILKLDATAYYTYLQDAMVRRDFLFNGQDSIIYDSELSQVQAIQNAANAQVYGIQFGFEAKLPKGFGLNAVYNFQRGTEELDDGSTSRSRHAAPMFGAAHLTYKHKGLLLDFYTVFSGGVKFEDLPIEEQGKPYIYARDSDGNPYSPRWLSVNFKASYRINKHFTVNAGVENLLDKRYKTYSSGIVAPGRNFILSGKLNF